MTSTSTFTSGVRQSGTRNAYTARLRNDVIAEIAATSVRAVARARCIPVATLKTWKAAAGLKRRDRYADVVAVVDEQGPISARWVATTLGIAVRTARLHLADGVQRQQLQRLPGNIPQYKLAPGMRRQRRHARLPE